MASRIAIEKSPDFKRISHDLRERAGRAFQSQLELETREIEKRTLSGRDVDGNQFAKYSEAYRKWKVEKKQRSNTVNLEFSGDMLAAMTTKVEKTATSFIGKIFFASAKEAAKARGNNRLRRFFGLSKEQIRRLSLSVKNALR